MKDFIKIDKIIARQILDSRGFPTVEAEVFAGGKMGRASVPSGASTGSFEAVELRDNEQKFLGKSVFKAVQNIAGEIAKTIVGENVFEQEKIDQKMISLDGTPNKSRLGANAILAVSLAVAKCAAALKNQPLYLYLGAEKGVTIPVPMMNILNGGKHADNSVNIQEFMIMPIGAPSFGEGMRWCVEVFHTLKKVLKKENYSTSVGDEGGFAPHLKNDEEAFKLIAKAVEKAGYKLGKDFCFAVDAAASEMREEARKIGKQNSYFFWKTGEVFSTKEMIEYWKKMWKKYPIFSLEDALSEEDWEGWKMLTKSLKIQLVGDDLFVTNTERISRGIKEKSANSVLIKPNQIGTLTETLNAVKLSQKNGFSVVISHRSGETEDTTIADLAVATNAGQIKTGAPSRSERVAKYNQLLRIEEDLGKRAKYPGKNLFKKS